MIGKILQKLVDDKLTSVKEMGELTGAAPSTVYRWIREESEPSFDSMRLLIRHVPNPQAQAQLLAAVAYATTWHFYNIEAELDVNHDGVVDYKDALDATIEAVRSASEALSEVRQASRGGAIGESDAEELAMLMTTVIRHCSITQRVLARLAEQRRKRKLKTS